MRQNRKLESRVNYHVTAFTSNRKSIFADDSNKELFLKTVREAKDKYRFKLYQNVIMNNSIHLLIAPDDEIASLSCIMQWILSVFALRYNKKYGTKGHVWGNRFHSSII